MTRTARNNLFYNIFDSHAHYTAPAYNGRLTQILDNVRNAGVAGIILPSTALSDSRSACILAEEYPFLYPAVGVHPLFIALPDQPTTDPASDRRLIPDNSGPLSPSDAIDTLRTLSGKYPIVAIGEIGLDYRRCKKDTDTKRLQKEFFDRQLSLCEELHLPALIHSIDAAADTLDLLRSHPNVTGVMHGFSYSPEVAGQCLQLGWRIGIGTTVLNPDARRIREVIRMLPEDRILLESDCPYRPNTKEPGQLPDSSVIIDIVYMIASIRNEDPQAITNQVLQNSRLLFDRKIL